MHAQYVDYALNLSMNLPGGTARSTAMAGAWGALGGDFYSASQNPAGLGYYRQSEFIFTPELYHNNTTSTYFGETNTNNAYNANINSIGYTNVSTNVAGVESLVFSVGYNKITNYSQNIYINGTNPDSRYAEIARDVLADYPDIDDPYFTNLFWDAYIIDYDSISQDFFVDPGAYDDFPVDQTFVINRTGNQNEWDFAMAINTNNKLYLGATFNVVSFKYSETFTMDEYDYTFSDTRELQGKGFSGKLGVNYTPVNSVRLGFAWHTPRYNRVTERYNSSLEVDNIGTYEPETSIEYDFNTITPGKLVGSLALIPSKYLLISTDFEYIDYSKTQILNGEDGESFADENSYFANNIYAAINSKTGFELRNGPFRLRGGFGYIGSPYKEISTEYLKDLNDLKSTSSLLYTAGVGFRTENFFVDFAYVYQDYEEIYNLYTDWDNSNSSYYVDNPSLLESINTRFMLTVGFRFD